MSANKKGNSNGIRVPRETITGLIKNIADSLSTDEEIEWTDKPWMMFSAPEGGGLHLIGDEVHAYQDCLNELAKAAKADSVKDTKISRKWLDDLLKQAILQSLDLKEQHPDTLLESRIPEVLDTLEKQLNLPPSNWRVYCRVSGLKPTEVRQKFGKVEFITFNINEFSWIRESIEQSSDDQKQKQNRIKIIQDSEELLLDQTVAIIEVAALDENAARAQSLRELSFILDILNFYSDFLSSRKSAYVTIWGERERHWEGLPAIKLEDQPLHSHFLQAVGRVEDFSLEELLDGRGKKWAAARVNDMLAKSSRNGVEERLLSAMQWAGRAAVEERKEEAFLFYAIALESLVMERGNEPELGYRLRMRIAHLLEDNLDDRKSVAHKISQLYGIRSAIVHRGEYLVADSDFQMIRFFAREAVMSVLIKKPFITLETDEQFLGWFNDQLLK